MKLNKAGYTAKLVAYGWAGAVIKYLGTRNNAANANNAEKANGD